MSRYDCEGTVDHIAEQAIARVVAKLSLYAARSSLGAISTKEERDAFLIRVSEKTAEAIKAGFDAYHKVEQEELVAS